MKTNKEENVYWQNSLIIKQDRAIKFGHKSFCVWFTGLSGSGKSTIAHVVEKKLFEKGKHVYVLDGDNIRHGLNKDLGFSPQDRTENIRRIGEAAKLFVDAGFIILCAFISPYKADRNNVRKLFPDNDFIEVYVKADIKTCEQRDTKGLYKKARQGDIKEFTGISAPYEPPVKPEIIIDTTIEPDVDLNADRIIKFLKTKYD